MQPMFHRGQTAQSAEGPWASLWAPLLIICLWLVADNSFSHGTMQLCNTIILHMAVWT